MQAVAGAPASDEPAEEKVVAVRQVRLLLQPAHIHGLPHTPQRIRAPPSSLLHHRLGSAVG